MLHRRGFLGLLTALPFAHKLLLSWLPPWTQVQLLMEEEIVRNARTTGYESQWGVDADLSHVPAVRFNADEWRIRTEREAAASLSYDLHDMEIYRERCLRYNVRFHGKLCPFDIWQLSLQPGWHDPRYCECPKYLDGRPYEVRAEEGEQLLRQRLRV